MGVYRHNRIQKVVGAILALIFFITILPVTATEDENKYLSVYKIYDTYHLSPPENKTSLEKEREALNRASLSFSSNEDYVEVVVEEASDVASQIENYKKDKNLTLNDLLFYKTVEEIENEVKEYKYTLEALESQLIYLSKTTYDIKISDEYLEIKERLETISKELPNSEIYEEIEYPNVHPATNVKQIVKKFNGKSTKYRAHEGTILLALFEGIISEITDNSIILSAGSGIKIEYKGFSDIAVYEGQRVLGYQKLGYSAENYEISLSLKGQYVDLEELNLSSFISKKDVKG